MNRVILIGESHYHGLNLARSFGVNGIGPIGIVVGNNDARILKSSKYWEKIYTVPDYEAAIQLVMELFGNEEEKPVVMPWSDGALFTIDSHLDKLKDHFLVSSIAGIQGEIGRWLNKKQQSALGRKMGLMSSPTEEVDIPICEEDVRMISDSFSFPVFLKPVDSREGSKYDMRKISNEDELIQYGAELQDRGFKRILVQNYLTIDVEYDLMGFCTQSSFSYTLVQKLRTWPINGGAACYGVVVPPGDLKPQFECIVRQLTTMGYTGPFDLDLFLVGDKLYFNEINWRSSANVYAAVKSGNNYPYLWYQSVAEGRKVSAEEYTSSGVYFMNEFWDAHHVLSHKVTLSKWLGDIKKAEAFAYFNSADCKPFNIKLKSAIKNKITKKQSNDVYK